jgi:hypothetical protein
MYISFVITFHDATPKEQLIENEALIENIIHVASSHMVHIVFFFNTSNYVG